MILTKKWPSKSSSTTSGCCFRPTYSATSVQSRDRSNNLAMAIQRLHTDCIPQCNATKKRLTANCRKSLLGKVRVRGFEPPLPLQELEPESCTYSTLHYAGLRFHREIVVLRFYLCRAESCSVAYVWSVGGVSPAAQVSSCRSRILQKTAYHVPSLVGIEDHEQRDSVLEP
jgi:hypothetical protein